MTIQTARRLLREPIEDMALERLQRHKVRILEAARESEAEYGFSEAVHNGFYKIISSDSATGCSPVDIWLSHELRERYNQCVKLETLMLRFPSDSAYQEWRRKTPV